jgi:hypothetical protein
VFEIAIKRNLAIAGLLLAIAASSAFYMLKGRHQDETLHEPLLVPVNIENLSEETTEDLDETQRDFSVKTGSEFSKQVLFICESGCLNEFPGEDDDEEIMCPHCGTIGKSPL